MRRWEVLEGCGRVKKEGRRGMGGKDTEVRAGNAGRSSGSGEWNVSQELYLHCSVKMWASAVGVTVQTATRQARELMCDIAIL